MRDLPGGLPGSPFACPSCYSPFSEAIQDGLSGNLLICTSCSAVSRVGPLGRLQRLEGEEVKEVWSKELEEALELVRVWRRYRALLRRKELGTERREA